MSNIPLWTDEYFIDRLERFLKHEISTYFYIHHERKPTKEEYEEYFKRWKDQAKCNVIDFDLGIYENQTCRFCENPKNILEKNTCCTRCNKLPKM